MTSFALQSEAVQAMINIKSGMEVFNEACLEIVSPPMGIQIPNWRKFSQFTGGLRMNEFTIFCGATGAGKTQFLANLLVHITKQNIKCFAAPVETGPTDLARRMISVVCKRDVNTGEALPMQSFSKRLSENSEIMENIFFSTHDNRVDIEEMIQTLKYMSEVNKVKIAVLDNLNFFLKPTKSSETMLEMDDAVHKFVMLAKSIPIHIFLVMHPRKTDGGKITSEFDIKGSSTAVQEASNILLMNRLDEDEYSDDPNGLNKFCREFNFKKIRKRGFYVNEKFYMKYDGGAYVEFRD
jgi:twinkle protein